MLGITFGFRKKDRWLARLAADDRGSTFMVVTALISTMAILGITVSTMTFFEQKEVIHQLHRTQALYLAEAGIENVPYDLAGSDLSDVIKGPDGQADTSDDGTLSSATIGNGSYTVTITDNDDGDGDLYNDSDGLVIANSTGTVVEQSITLGMTLASSGGMYTSPYAILTGGDLEISGNPTITGANGGIHANDDLSIPGNPNIDQDATAVDNYNASGSPTVGGNSGGGFATTPIPEVVPSDYLSDADYVLRSDGDVEDSFGNVIASNSYNGWNWGGDKWDRSSNSANDGTYYIEGDAIVSGNPGTSSDPWKVTIIAEGSIEISGDPKIEYDTPSILMVAGGDLKLNGNPNQDLEGYFLVHEQLEFSGNSNIIGSIIVEDAEDNHGFASENKVSGEPNIHYDGDISAPSTSSTGGQLSVMGWYHN